MVFIRLFDNSVFQSGQTQGLFWRRQNVLVSKPNLNRERTSNPGLMLCPLDSVSASSPAPGCRTNAETLTTFTSSWLLVTMADLLSAAAHCARLEHFPSEKGHVSSVQLNEMVVVVGGGGGGGWWWWWVVVAVVGGGGGWWWRWWVVVVDYSKVKGNIPRISSYTWLFAKNTGWFVVLRSNP